MKPHKMQYTGQEERLSWSTKRYVRFVAADGEVVGSGFEFYYETPDQQAEHKRLIESARPARP